MLSSSRLQRWLGRPAAYAEHEELQAFQHRFLSAMALSSAGLLLVLITTSLLLNGAHTAEVTRLWGVTCVANLALWGWLRHRPRQLQLGSLVSATLGTVTLTSTVLVLPPDPLLPMWTLLLVLFCFIMLGRWWGWLSAGVALGVSWWMLQRVDLALYPNAPWTLLFSTLGCAVLCHVYAERFDFFFQRIAQHHAQLRHLSSTDHLTGALNAGAYYAQCDRALARARRSAAPCAVLFVDLDHFKHINDSWGHATGDHVLQQTALVLRHCLREGDLLGRVGGEEFSVLMPDASRDAGLGVAERMRAAVEQQRLEFNGRQLQVTASVGLTWLADAAHGPQTIHAIQQMADQAMYDAKRAGRNRVSVFAP